MAHITRLTCSVIATVSGDGLIYEVFNGLAARPDAKKALKTPIGPIPTGTIRFLACTPQHPR